MVVILMKIGVRIKELIQMNEYKTNINWYKPTYGKLPMKSYK